MSDNPTKIIEQPQRLLLLRLVLLYRGFASLSKNKDPDLIVSLTNICRHLDALCNLKYEVAKIELVLELREHPNSTEEVEQMELVKAVASLVLRFATRLQGQNSIRQSLMRTATLVENYLILKILIFQENQAIERDVAGQALISLFNHVVERPAPELSQIALCNSDTALYLIGHGEPVVPSEDAKSKTCAHSDAGACCESEDAASVMRDAKSKKRPRMDAGACCESDDAASVMRDAKSKTWPHSDAGACCESEDTASVTRDAKSKKRPRMDDSIVCFEHHGKTRAVCVDYRRIVGPVEKTTKLSTKDAIVHDSQQSLFAVAKALLIDNNQASGISVRLPVRLVILQVLFFMIDLAKSIKTANIEGALMHALLCFNASVLYDNPSSRLRVDKFPTFDDKVSDQEKRDILLECVKHFLALAIEINDHKLHPILSKIIMMFDIAETPVAKP
jgi:hypothetical protein